MIYLNYAATSWKRPPEVAVAVMEAMNGFGNAARGASAGELDAGRTIFETRCLIARLFEFDYPERVVFTANATQALNTVLLGMFEPGDEIITTDWEHNSVLRPLNMLRLRGIKVHMLRSDKHGVLKLERAETLINRRTKAIVCTHASNLTGNLQDLKLFEKWKEMYNLMLIVDAAQTAGCYPISMKQMGIDVLCFTGHKGLMGPQGTGGILVSPGISIRSLLSGGTGIQSYSPFQPEEYPAHLEAGTLNGHGIAGLHAAICFIQKTGVETIHQKELQIARLFQKEIEGIPGIRLYGEFDRDRMPVVSLNLKDISSAETADALWSMGEIAVRAGAHCAPEMHRALGTEKQGAVRFSFGYYTEPEEIHTAVELLRRMAE